MIMMFKLLTISICWFLVAVSSCYESPKENITLQGQSQDNSSKVTSCEEVLETTETDSPSHAEFKLFVRPKTKTWDRVNPLVVCVTFKNDSSKIISINTKSNFNFFGGIKSRNEAELTDGSGNASQDHLRTWQINYQPKGEIRIPTKEDYVELLPGKSYTVELTGNEITPSRIPIGEKPKQIDDKTILPGEYWLVTTYSSGDKTSSIPNGWEGQISSGYTKLLIK